MRIGIDLGGMSAKLGLVNEKNEIVGKLVIPTRLDVPAREMIHDMAEAVKKLAGEHGLQTEELEGIGIGSPGTVDQKTGSILYSNNFSWEDVPILSILKEYLGPIPMDIANDADAAALGEVCAGAAKGAKNAILLTLGTGVGGGVGLDGKIFRGGVTGGCELGHMAIVENGQLCTCGRRGCLEAYASASALLRMARKAAAEHPESVMNEMCGGDLEKMNGKIPFDAAAAGDAAGYQVVEEYENHLAFGIANLINIFRPEMVILGGGVAAQKENLTVPLQKKTECMCFGGRHGQIAPIVTSCLGNDAGIIGAANLIEI